MIIDVQFINVVQTYVYLYYKKQDIYSTLILDDIPNGASHGYWASSPCSKIISVTPLRKHTH